MTILQQPASPLTGLQDAPLQWTFMDQFFKYMVFASATYDSVLFDLNDPAELQAAVNEFDMDGSNGLNANLEPFRDNGGKLLMYHGWSDQALSPLATLDFYNKVIEYQHGSLSRTRDFARLFMVPGMHHCADGPGPNVFDTLTPLDSWVTTGEPPDSIIASHYENNDLTQPIDRTMPLCAYPEVAAFTGGDVNQASNWRCEFPEKPHHHH